jgi:hypothetical protein
VDREVLVPSFVSVTVAPLTAAPVLSVTVPVTREVVPCPNETTASENARARAESAVANGLLPIFNPPRLLNFLINKPDDKQVFGKNC